MILVTTQQLEVSMDIDTNIQHTVHPLVVEWLEALMQAFDLKFVQVGQLLAYHIPGVGEYDPERTTVKATITCSTARFSFMLSRWHTDEGEECSDVSAAKVEVDFFYHNSSFGRAS
ncbi:MAG: hypothetical protein HQ488_01700 [Parcubacteria group bacterium]|nr:hypothetical protein [Parcubacteria group bacterium]